MIKLALFLSILSPVLLTLSFPKFDFEFFAWFSFLPLFFAIKNCSMKKAFWLSYLSGSIFFTGTLFWIWNVTGLGLILLVSYLGLFFGIFGVAFKVFEKRGLWVLPLVWVVLEWLRGHLLTGFPWCLLGYSQYLNLYTIQIASVFSVYGVSFLVMFVNVALFDIFRKRYLLIFLSMLLIAGNFIYGRNEISKPVEGKGFRVAVVQGNIPMNLKWIPENKEEVLDKYLSLSRKVISKKPDLIVWPETAYTGDFIEDKLNKKVFKFVKENNIYLLLGSARSAGKEGSFNSAILVSPNGRIDKIYDKVHLVPFGEFVPLERRFPFLVRLIEKTAGFKPDFVPAEDYTVFGMKEVNFSVLICFEDIFPELSKRFRKEGADFLINITNDGWFGKTSAPYQHAAMSVFRAVENRCYVVRCAGTGVCSFIDSKGRIIGEIGDIFKEGYLIKEIKI